MDLADLKVKEYLDVLQSDAPAPGGGSVSALAGAQGIALMMMVADLTCGREKYSAFEDVCKKVKTEAVGIFRELTAAVDKDTMAYNKVMEAYKMPKDNEEQKEKRKKAIREANLEATEVPYQVMEFSHKALMLAETMLGKCNPNAASDLGVAAVSLMNAVKGAWLNVRINMPGLKDEKKEKYYMENGGNIYKDAEKRSDKIYEVVLKEM
ncbi:MAG TPA: cyclodeaminase/cyclohydrolase family protein [Bacillota bacterium]|nr:cyclodeaminase/cyclohydrolase family protein [Bacillota bacterium]HUM55869.1 cyclodeaminase/cyclohydrolase family protein [Bacillota bacterium]